MKINKINNEYSTFDKKLFAYLVCKWMQRFLYFSERWLFSTIINIWYFIFIIQYGAGLVG